MCAYHHPQVMGDRICFQKCMALGSANGEGYFILMGQKFWPALFPLHYSEDRIRRLTAPP